VILLERLRERRELAVRDRALERERSQPATWRRRGPGGFVRPAERYGHLASTAHVQAAYPFVAQAGLGSRGVLVGRNVYGGVFALDPWELYVAGLLQDPNMLVLGLKGYGKSALLKTWCFRQRVFGRRIEVIERKGEYQPLMEAMGGVTLRLEPGVRLNPLERIGSQASRESLLRAVARALLGRELAPVERVGLSAALAAVDARCSEREVVIPDVVSELREPSAELALELNMTQRQAGAHLREGTLALRDLSTGPLRGMFDGPTSAGSEVWDRPAVAIDISQIAEHAHGADENVALAIALVCATAFLDARRRERADEALRAGGQPERTVRVNDEAWRALSVPGAAEYYSAALKLSRKTGVQYVIALHRLSDLSATGDAGSRMQQLAEGLAAEAAIRVVYRQDPQEVPLTAGSLQLTSTERELIKTLGQGEALWRVGERGFLVRHLIAAAEWDLVQTDEGMGMRLPRAVGGRA
jgi:hypothetical protein